MLEMPIIEPPGGDWAASWRAPAWIVWKAPVRFVVSVEDHRVGVMLGWKCQDRGTGEMVMVVDRVGGLCTLGTL